LSLEFQLQAFLAISLVMLAERFRFDSHAAEGPNHSGISVGVGVNVGTSIVGGEEVSVAIEVGVAVPVFDGVGVGVFVGV